VTGNDNGSCDECRILVAIYGKRQLKKCDKCGHYHYWKDATCKPHEPIRVTTVSQMEA
jgi:hypothetical protein